MPYAVRMAYANYCTVCGINVPYAVCRMPYAVCSMPYSVCHMPYAVCHMRYAVCGMPYAVCGMRYVPYATYAICVCRIPNVLCGCS